MVSRGLRLSAIIVILFGMNMGEVGMGETEGSKKYSGKASTYGWGEKLNKTTASGAVFNPHGKTAAMYGPKFGSTAKVTDKATGRSVNVTITDRGPNKRLGRVIDLSQGAWRDLGYKKPGLTNVDVEVQK